MTCVKISPSPGLLVVLWTFNGKFQKSFQKLNGLELVYLVCYIGGPFMIVEIMVMWTIIALLQGHFKNTLLETDVLF